MRAMSAEILQIFAPSNLVQARKYIFEVLFKEFLGLPFNVTFEERADVCIKGPSDKSLMIEDVFFNHCWRTGWLSELSLPQRPLQTLAQSDLASLGVKELLSPLPIIYGKRLSNGSFVQVERDKITIGLDIFGSSFFMLSRYEEAVDRNKDSHGRFVANFSLAKKENFLHRPIVNEYLEALWGSMKILWPQLDRKPREFRILPSHDVDHPFLYHLSSPISLAKPLLKEIVSGKLDGAVNRFSLYRKSKIRNGEDDPYNTFSWLMDQAEKVGCRTSFYFMAGGSSKFDDLYSLRHPSIQKIIREIKERGHEIGFHPSYNAYSDAGQWNEELQNLSLAAGVKVLGGRQHYLRFQVPDTWRLWEEAKCLYDSSLGYPDVIGFRCGTCYEYPVFDVQEQRALRLKERPLLVMETSLFSKKYMGLELGTAIDRALSVKETCKKFHGDFSFLWHNSKLYSDELRNAFVQLLVS